MNMILYTYSSDRAATSVLMCHRMCVAHGAAHTTGPYSTVHTTHLPHRTFSAHCPLVLRRWPSVTTHANRTIVTCSPSTQNNKNNLGIQAAVYSTSSGGLRVHRLQINHTACTHIWSCTLDSMRPVTAASAQWGMAPKELKFKSSVKPSQAESSRVKPSQAKSSHVKPRQATSSHVKPRQAMSSHVKPCRIKPRQVKPRCVESSRASR